MASGSCVRRSARLPETSPVLDDDLHRIRVAAADKESLEFELDSANLVLEEAITEAASHGQDILVIAAAAELPVEEIIELVEETDDVPAVQPKLSIAPGKLTVGPVTARPSTAAVT